MKYIGSKSKIAEEIIEIMQPDIDRAAAYIEPFVGGCNVIDQVKHDTRIGCDGNPYLIAMWRAIQKGWEPPDTITKDQYQFIKHNKRFFRKEFLGFVGHACSFSGDWFAGYAGTNEPERNRCLDSKNAVLKQKEKIKDVSFHFRNYKTTHKLEPWFNTRVNDFSVFYCDPPYFEGHEYKGSVYDFNHGEFWKWCRKRAKHGHIVYVSDYFAPDDFKLVWEKEVTINAHQTSKKTRVEKLYKLGDII